MNDLCITDPFSRVLAHRVYRQTVRARADRPYYLRRAYLPKSMVLDDGVEDERDGEDFTRHSIRWVRHHERLSCTVLIRSIVSVSDDYAPLSVHPLQPVEKRTVPRSLVLAKAIEKAGFSVRRAQRRGRPRSHAHLMLRSLSSGKRVPEADAIQCAVIPWDGQTLKSTLPLCVDFAPAMNLRDVASCGPSALTLINQLRRAIRLSGFRPERQHRRQILEAFAQNRRLVVGSGFFSLWPRQHSRQLSAGAGRPAPDSPKRGSGARAFRRAGPWI